MLLFARVFYHSKRKVANIIVRLFLLYDNGICVYGGTLLEVRGQPHRSQVSSSTLRISGTELWSLGLAADAIIHWAILPTLNVVFNLDLSKNTLKVNCFYSTQQVIAMIWELGTRRVREVTTRTVCEWRTTTLASCDEHCHTSNRSGEHWLSFLVLIVLKQ